MLRYFVSASTKDSRRKVVCLSSISRKPTRFNTPETSHVEVVRLGYVSPDGPIAELPEIRAALTNPVQDGNLVVVIESWNFLLLLHGLHRTVAFLHYLNSVVKCRTLGILRLQGVRQDEIAALERYSTTVFRLSVDNAADVVYGSSENTVHGRWVQKSSTGSITSGVRYFILIS